MPIDKSRSFVSRFVRGGFLVAASVASIATFGAEPKWELHDQLKDDGTTVLSATTPTFMQLFDVNGDGTGARRMQIDSAIEVTPSNPLAAPVRVKLTFVPTGSPEVLEEIVFVTEATVFTAVTHDVRCNPEDTSCTTEGTMSVEVMDVAELGAETLAIHWVETGSLFGVGPAVPADGRLEISTP